jgi:hypothetical protein
MSFIDAGGSKRTPTASLSKVREQPPNNNVNIKTQRTGRFMAGCTVLESPT